MHFWDWKTGHNFQKLQAVTQPGSLDSEAGIFKCCFDVSGCRLITAEADKTIKVYKEDETAVSFCSVTSSQILTGTNQCDLSVLLAILFDMSVLCCVSWLDGAMAMSSYSPIYVPLFCLL